jgi:hypothetical protein
MLRRVIGGKHCVDVGGKSNVKKKIGRTGAYIKHSFNPKAHITTMK